MRSRLPLRVVPLLLALLLPGAAQAANITSATCTASVTTGCVNLWLGDYTYWRSVSAQVTGTWAATLVFEGSNDNATWVPIRAWPSSSPVYVTATVSNGAWQLDTAGLVRIRVRASSYTSGTAVVTLQLSPAPPPTPSAIGGTVDVEVRTNPVTVTGTVAVSDADGGAVKVEQGDTRWEVELGPATVNSLALTPCSPYPKTYSFAIDAGVCAWMPEWPDGGDGTDSTRTAVAMYNGDNNDDYRCGVPLPDGGGPGTALPGPFRLLPPGGEWRVEGYDAGMRIRCCNPGGNAGPVSVTEETCGL